MGGVDGIGVEDRDPLLLGMAGLGRCPMSDKRKPKGCSTCGGPCAPYPQCWTCWGKESGVPDETIKEWQAEDVG